MITGLAFTILVGYTLGFSEAQNVLSIPAIYEDEYTICNFEDVCTIIAIDDLDAEELKNRFANDLDTFSLND